MDRHRKQMRTAAACLALLLSCTAAHAYDVKPYGSLDLLGYLDHKTTLEIDETGASKEFNLDSADIAPKTTNVAGREIGRWSLFTNTTVTLSVSTTPMTNPVNMETVSYQIAIQYPAKADSTDIDDTALAYISNTGGSDATWETEEGGAIRLGSSERVMAYMNNPIYFRLYDKVADEYGAGHYTGSVVFTLVDE